MTSEDILKAFEIELICDGKAKKTVESYTGDIRDFLEWLKGKKVIFEGNMTRFFITQYKEHLVGKKYSVDTINKKINSLSCSNQYLIREKYTTDLVVFPRKDKVKVAAGSEKEVEVFSDEEVQRILFYLESKDISLRNKLIVHMLLYTGVRVSELTNIKITDIVV